MVGSSQGLTKTYNALKDTGQTDATLLELRGLHEAVDRAVMDAYGWNDLVVPTYCPKSEAERAAVRAFEEEVIDRLYVLNAERARDEQLLGTAAVRTATDTASGDLAGLPGPSRGAADKKMKEQGKLFDS
jgi:hypothetical protein